jgi:hypothetical protein
MFDRVEALREVEAALDRASAAGVDLIDSSDAVEAIRAVESVRRKAAALAVEVQCELDRSQAFRYDGHFSAKAMARHVGRLSPGEAAGRARGARMAPVLPAVTAALGSGTLGVAQFDLLGRVHANPRVRDSMADAQQWFLERASVLSFADFELVVRQWERLVDADGPEPANSRHHDHRNASLLQDRFDLSWHLKGSFAAGQGASMDDIYAHYIEAERLADWEKARAEHGDTATEAHLPRTEPQRRADALWQLFQHAAGAGGTAVPPDFVHNIIWNAEAYEEMLSRLDANHATDLDPDTYRCETLDGIPLEPVEAAADSLTAKVRRVIVSAAGVVIDLGRARTFTGGARTATQLDITHCPWPGCVVRTSHCEIDHTVEHGIGGRTNPDNGGPLCARHNRWKQKSFTTWRDPTGTWHTYRPDGTEIE